MPLWIGVPFVVVGVMQLVMGIAGPGTWVQVACGAVVSAWFGSRRWRDAAVVWLDADGLGARAWRGRRVAWRDVEELALTQRGKDWFLALRRSAAARAAAPAEPLQRQIAARAAAADLALPLGGLRVTPQQVADAARLLHAQARG